MLIVDDEPMLRLLLRLVLENDGHEVRDADDGRDALIRIGSWHPHVVVTELNLPGLDGADLVKRMRIRADSAHMRIVATSLSIPSDIEVDAAFTKPYEAQLVAKEIDSMVSGMHDDVGLSIRQADDADVRARTLLLGDIWRRLVNVDSQAHDCDADCDVALEEIRRLATWVDDRVSSNQHERLSASPNGRASGVLRH